GVYDRNVCTHADLRHAANISSGDDLGLCFLDVRDLARPQPVRDVRLQDVIGPGGAATDMRLRHILDLEPHFREQELWLFLDLLSVLHRAGGMIGYRVTGLT